MTKTTDYHANITMYTERADGGMNYLFVRKDVDLLCVMPLPSLEEADRELWARAEAMRRLLSSPALSTAVAPSVKSISSELLDRIELIIVDGANAANNPATYQIGHYRRLAVEILKALGYEDQ